MAKWRIRVHKKYWVEEGYNLPAEIWDAMTEDEQRRATKTAADRLRARLRLAEIEIQSGEIQVIVHRRPVLATEELVNIQAILEIAPPEDEGN